MECFECGKTKKCLQCTCGNNICVECVNKQSDIKNTCDLCGDITCKECFVVKPGDTKTYCVYCCLDDTYSENTNWTQCLELEIKSTAMKKMVPKIDYRKYRRIMECVLCGEEKKEYTQCLCGKSICHDCFNHKSQDYDEESYYFESQCCVCNKQICIYCGVFCYECANTQEDTYKTYCSKCPNDIISVKCQYHKWTTCSAEHPEKEYEGCGICAHVKGKYESY